MSDSESGNESTGTLVAAFERRLEFYSADQPRDKKGQFATTPGSGPGPNKTWTGRSAHPATREEPVTFVRLRHNSLEPSLTDDARDIVSWFEGDLGGGYSSHVPVNAWGEPDIKWNRVGTGYPRSSDANALTVRGVIRDVNGVDVGGWTRQAVFEPDTGKLHIVHESMILQAKHQGLGLADRFNARAVAHYQQEGVDRIVVQAAMEVGSYAWARQGFRVNGREDDRIEAIGVMATRVATAVDKARDAGHLTPEQHKEARRRTNIVDNASRNGKDVQPWDVAHIGESDITWTERREGNNVKMWPGKAGLLSDDADTYSGWFGVYFFDRGAKVTASAVELDHVEARGTFGASLGLELALRRHLDRELPEE